jgi:acyl dehydratase
MEVMNTYRVRARNTATDSENRIHDDRTAEAYGFRGGLVPGVTIYGYLTVPIVDRFGADWLARGGLRVSFLNPVYAGDDVVVELDGDRVDARGPDGTVCATGHIFWPVGAPPSVILYPEAPLPPERPPASSVSLAPGQILGSLCSQLCLPDDAFLAEQDETLAIYREGTMHPAALLSLCNQLLLQNVKLGPWIHVASEVRHFSLARDGDQLSVRGRVAQRFERKGHQFVELDILVAAGEGRVVQQVRHTAIYEPRRPH